MNYLKYLPLISLLAATHVYADVAGYIVNQGSTKVVAKTTSYSTQFPSTINPNEALWFKVNSATNVLITYSDAEGHGCVFHIFGGAQHSKGDVSTVSTDGKAICSTMYNGAEYLLTVNHTWGFGATKK